MFMAGNISTGMRARLVIPTTAMMRQTTTMKYGFRMAKLDMLLIRGGHRGHFWLHFLAGLKAAMTPENDQIAFVQSRADFHLIGGFDSQLDLAELDAMVRRNHRHLAGGRALRVRLNGVDGGGQRLITLRQREVYLRIH